MNLIRNREKKLVEFKLKINKSQRVAYIPRKLVDEFGNNLNVLPNANAAIVYSEGKPLELVIKSVELLLEDLKLRKESG